MRELQDALDRWHNHPNSLLAGDIDLFVRAARKYANPDIEAATEAVGQAWVNARPETATVAWTPGLDLLAKAAVDAALGTEPDE